MEWLSHTQKKYCELCKTPFRFTKLYHPQMPTRLPTAVFLRRAVFHLLAYMLTWCRALLVAFVWIVCLPWCMRSAWSMMFWFGDAGWARDRLVNETTISAWMDEHLAGIQKLPFQESNATNENLTAALENTASTGGKYTLNPTLCSCDILTRPPLDVIPWGLLKTIGRGLLTALHYDAMNLSALGKASERGESPPVVIQPSSLLSDVPFLKDLFPSPYVNRLIIDVLEGQIITLSVVVAFILVFLIREWVVQQQPVMDIAAAEDDEALAEAGGDVFQDPLQGLQEINPGSEDEDEDLSHLVGVDSGTIVNADGANEAPDVTSDPGMGASTGPHGQNLRDTANDTVNAGVEWSNHPSRPQMPSRDRSFMATEIRRNLEENELGDRQSTLDAPELPPFPSTPELEENNSQGTGSTGSWQRIDRDGNVQPRQSIFIEDLEVCSIFLDSNTLNISLTYDVPDCRVISWNRLTFEQIRGPLRVVNPDEDSSSPDPRSPISDDLDSDSSDSDEDDRGKAARLNAERHGKLHGFFGNDLYSLNPNHGLANDAPGTESSSTENNPFHPDYVGPPFDRQADTATQPARLPPTGQAAPNPSIFDRIVDYFWGDVDVDRTETADSSESDVDDAHVVQNLADEAPFIPIFEGQPMLGEDADDGVPGGPVQDPEVAAAAAQAGVAINEDDAGDPDDAEDLEGILELIGMQGPLIGLFQNALFSAVLIGATVVAAVFLPYLWGKLTLLAIAKPMLILQIPVGLVSAIVDFALDAGFAFVCTILAAITGICDSFGFVFNLTLKEKSGLLLATAWKNAESAWSRAFNSGFLNTPRSEDLLFFSIESHAALHWLEAKALTCITQSTNFFLHVLNSFLRSPSIWSAVDILKPAAIHQDLSSLAGALENFTAESISYIVSGASLDIYHQTDVGGVTFSPLLPHWTAMDRVLATITGYILLLTASIVYTSYLAPLFPSHPRVRPIEASIIDFLHQAGGVAKVIFIISIEMIVFPLFCGILLTVALAPLFPSSTAPGPSSLPFPRWLQFPAEGQTSSIGLYTDRPLTTLFLSWFLGTAYMFHFALFVSLCRRIMRPGVLYFIRDPDDPSFHPVRDVLERSVWGQLRKIGFSACVYGALILGALGGVVWAIAAAGHGVLPIRWHRWGTGGPLEFPMDILFYNFLTPVIVRFARPSDGLHHMYKWWFRRCARALRLSSFLFGERRKDEEHRHSHKAWWSWIQPLVSLAEAPSDDKEVSYIPDGKFIRAPSSDAVRIPKGYPVFVEVNVEDQRLDGKPDDGVHKGDLFKVVYVPPWFGLRIAAFVLLVWLFAAVTGVGITILPLLSGRIMMNSVFGASEDTNDIYAVTLGVYTLGGLLYIVFNIPHALRWLRSCLPESRIWSFEAIATSIVSAAKIIKQTASTVYVYTAFLVVIPLLHSILLELYVLLPLHTFLTTSDGTRDSSQTHTINIIQSWTLGLLYTRLLARYTLHARTAPPFADDGADPAPAPDPDADPRPGLMRRHELERAGAPAPRRRNRLGEAARRVFRGDGASLLHPHAARATRYFVAPALLAFAALACGPPVAARVALALLPGGVGPRAAEVWVARASYPLALGLIAAVWAAGKVRRGFGRWVGVVRDEVYLVGERLHNYGERARRRDNGRGERSKGKERAVDAEGGAGVVLD